MKNISVTPFIDSYHPQKDDRCKISIRLTFQRKKKYYPTKINLTVQEYDRVMNAKRKTNEEKESYNKIIALIKEANDAIEKIPVFTFEKFEKLFVQNKGITNSILNAYNEKITALKANDQIGTANNYQCAINSLGTYKQALTYVDITPEFLKGYEKFMTDHGKSKTTVSMYLRTLRTILNEAVAENLIDKSIYPFRQQRSDKKKYSPPAPKNLKRALTRENLEKFYSYNSVFKGLNQARDFWVLSYLLNGMNMKDILLLRNNNIRGNLLIYERVKTSGTKEEPTKIKASLKPEALTIIKRYSQPNINPEAYLFSVLNEKMDAPTKHRRSQTFILNINKNLKKICRELDIPDITTYWARHTFSTVLKNAGVSVEFISEALGHSDIKTTKNYLSSFEDEMIHKTTDILTSFETAG